MKMQFKFIGLLLFLGILVSCEDAYIIDQDGWLTDETVFETVEDLQKGLNGVYSTYAPHDEIAFSAIFTDEIKNGFSNTGWHQSEYDHVITTNFTMGGILGGNAWTNRMATINRANRVIEAADLIHFETEEDQENADQILGQAYALRAISHFDMMKYYAINLTDDGAEGVPIVDYVPTDPNDMPERKPVGEVWDFILGDLDTAENLMGAFNIGNDYLSTDAVIFTRARVLQFRGQYQQAAAIAQDLLAKYPLADTGDYVALFQDGSDKELIWKKQVLTRSNIEIASLFYWNSIQSDPDPLSEMSNGLYNILSPSDVRYQVLTSPLNEFVGENDPENILMVYKYPGSSVGPLSNDLKLMRSSELVLIIAEAAAREGDLTGAAQALQQLVDARYVSGAPNLNFSSQNAAYTELLKQSRIEFAYEGKRYLDIKRFRSETNLGVNRDDTDCASFNATECNISATDYRWILPIPQSELRANSVITQAPGY